MTRSVQVARRLALPALLLLALAGLFAFYSSPSPKQKPVAAPLAADAPKKDSPETLAGAQPPPQWPIWGGALNSAEQAGPGFFTPARRRAFLASIQNDLKEFVVELNSRALLPLAGEKNLDTVLGPASKAVPEKSVAKRAAYLQFYEGPSDAERTRLAGLGLDLLSYYGGHAWSARGTRDAFEAALKLPNVRGTAMIDPRDKLSATVFSGETPDYALASDGRTRFRLLEVRGVSGEEFLQEQAQKLKADGSFDVKAGSPTALGLRFDVQARRDRALELAALDTVAYVELAAPPAASRDATTDLESNIEDVRDAPPNLSGAGVTVAVREIGKPVEHVDLTNRLHFIDSDGSTAGPAGHATAVCGQIGSSGVNQPSAKGVAPAVNMLIYAVNPDTFLISDIQNAASQNVRISNHSYGPTGLLSTDFGSYESDSANWDAELKQDDLIAVFAGNEETGGLSNHIDYFVGMKNGICVGASSSIARAFDDSPAQAPLSAIAYYSEFGPMNDGRVKPDLVAFGGDNPGPSDTGLKHVTLIQGTNSTQTVSGTSFAAPAVTGVTALVFQRYVTVVGKEPSAALTKALLCNSATDLGNPGPDQTYGFGIVNAEQAIKTIDLRTSDSSSPFLESTVSQGGVFSTGVSVTDSKFLNVTLCWMDPAGTPGAAKALVNDLDLELQSPDGTIVYPFSLNPARPSDPATAIGPNSVDPIEQISVVLPAAGSWTLRVKGTNISQGSQKFAVCLNQVATPPPFAVYILASPETGPVPLPVNFSVSNGSFDSQATFVWTFGDDHSTQTGPIVNHIFLQSGSFTVTLTATSSTGQTSTREKIIDVGKRDVSTFGEKATVRFDFQNSGSKKGDQLDIAMIANDPVKDLSSAAAKGFIFPRTRQQTREALADGEFEGQNFTLRVLRRDRPASDPDSIGLGSFSIAQIVLDRHASFKAKVDVDYADGSSGKADVSVRLNLLTGEIRIQVKDPTMDKALNLDSATAGPLYLSAEFARNNVPASGELVVYKVNYTLQYSSKGKGATGKAP